MNKRLSLPQTLQLAWWEIPSFRMAVLLAGAGIAVAAVFAIVRFADNKLDIIALVGAFISYAGFDQISKIVTGLKDATESDYQEAKQARKKK